MTPSLVLRADCAPRTEITLRTLGKQCVGLGLVMACLVSARRNDQEAQSRWAPVERLRDAVAAWVGARSPVRFKTAMFSQTTAPETDFGSGEVIGMKSIGAVKILGTLLVTEDGICLFRLRAREWIKDPHEEFVDARDVSSLPSAAASAPPMTFDGSELPDRGIHDDAVFYKHGQQLLVWSKDQTWAKLDLGEIHAPQMNTIGPSKRLAAIVGDDDLASGVYSAIEDYAFTVDPRSLFPDADIRSNGVVMAGTSIGRGVEFGLKMRLARELARTISNCSMSNEENDASNVHIPGLPDFPKSGEVLDSEVVFGLSAELKVVDVTIRMAHHCYEDIEHPKNEHRVVEVFDFVPEEGGAPRMVPDSIRRALGVAGQSPRSIDAWADVLLAAPDAGVVPDGRARAEITAIGLPWKIRDRSSGMTMVLVPPGEFDMGSSATEGQSDERPRHRVRISRPFYVGQFEVTQEQYEKVVGENPSFKKAGPAYPVDQVSFDEISRRDGFLDRTGLRLLTEAEWE